MTKLFVAVTLVLLPAMAKAVNGNELKVLKSVVRRVACYARNDRGVTFEAVGTYAPQVESSVLIRCRSHGNRSCHAAGCRVVYLREGS